MKRRSFLATGLAASARFALADQPEITSMTVRQASELIRSKKVSSVELTRACLARIENLQPLLNAYITITADQALADARRLDDERQRGKWRGPFHGVPIALKDNIDTAGVRTTGASQLFKDRIPTEDAEVARRLKNAGVVLLGKLNLHEFAYGGTSAVSYFGPVHNPWDPALTPGGSSGGPGAAVATGMCFASVGTDTAGSIRIPASYCGIVGFKPTYGRVSIGGIIPVAWSLDHAGPMSKTVEDAAIMMNVIAGYDPRDITALDAPVPDHVRALHAPTSKLRLGIPRKPFYDDLNADVGKAMDTALSVLQKLTRRIWMCACRSPPIAARSFALKPTRIINRGSQTQNCTTRRCAPPSRAVPKSKWRVMLALSKGWRRAGAKSGKSSPMSTFCVSHHGRSLRSRLKWD